MGLSDIIMRLTLNPAYEIAKRIYPHFELCDESIILKIESFGNLALN